VEIELIAVIMFTISVFVAAGLGIYALRLRRLDPKYVKEKVKMYQDLADEYKDEATLVPLYQTLLVHSRTFYQRSYNLSCKIKKFRVR